MNTNNNSNGFPIYQSRECIDHMICDLEHNQNPSKADLDSLQCLRNLLVDIPNDVKQAIYTLERKGSLSQEDLSTLVYLRRLLNDFITNQHTLSFLDQTLNNYRTAHTLVSDLRIHLPKRPIADKKSFLDYRYLEEQYRLELIRLGHPELI